MKKIGLALLLLVFLQLCACSRLVRSDYLELSPHKIPEEEQTPSVPTVSTESELRSTVLSWIENGTEHGVMNALRYQGDLPEEMQALMERLRTQEPIAAYAVDYADYTCKQTEDGYTVTVDFVYRRSVQEVASIESVRGTERAKERIAAAMQSFSSALTMKVTGYTSCDFEGYIRQYCLENPQTVMEFPTTAVSVYPEEGSTRIVEIHFGYHSSRETLSNMLSSVTTVLNSAAYYIRYGENAPARLELLCDFMLGRFTYTEGRTDTPAYSLLSAGIADDRSFAAVLNVLCRRASIPCELVCGELNGAERYWNIVTIDEQSYHLDLFALMQQGQTRYMLYADSDFSAQGYVWDTEQYPACPATEQLIQPETTEPTEETTAPSETAPPQSTQPETTSSEEPEE